MRYQRRNLPCCIDGKDLTWCVAGEELSEDCSRSIGAGIIEWCVDKEDAERVLARIEQDPHFQHLQIARWGD